MTFQFNLYKRVRIFCWVSIFQYCAFLFPDLLKRGLFSEFIKIWQITCFGVLPWSHLPYYWCKTKFNSKTSKWSPEILLSLSQHRVFKKDHPSGVFPSRKLSSPSTIFLSNASLPPGLLLAGLSHPVWTRLHEHFSGDSHQSPYPLVSGKNTKEGHYWEPTPPKMYMPVSRMGGGPPTR